VDDPWPEDVGTDEEPAPLEDDGRWLDDRVPPTGESRTVVESKEDVEYWLDGPPVEEAMLDVIVGDDIPVAPLAEDCLDEKGADVWEDEDGPELEAPEPCEDEAPEVCADED
jgi:hypothetical protein